MIEESKDLIEYKMKVVRKDTNRLNFNAGFVLGGSIIMMIIILSIKYFISSSPELLRFVNMVTIEGPEIMIVWYIISIATILLFIVGVILAVLASRYEDKISKGDLSFIK